MYFELDDTLQLMEQERTELGAEILCMDLGAIPDGKLRSPYLVRASPVLPVPSERCSHPPLYLSLSLCLSVSLSLCLSVSLYVQAVGDVHRTVRLLDLNPGRELNEVATQGMRDGDMPESVKLVELLVHGSTPGLYLNVGTTNGLLQRSEVERNTGRLSDTRTRCVGVYVWVCGCMCMCVCLLSVSISLFVTEAP